MERGGREEGGKVRKRGGEEEGKLKGGKEEGISHNSYILQIEHLPVRI